MSLPELIIVLEDQIVFDKQIESDFLKSRKLYKTLSLLLSSRSGMKIAPTSLLFLANRISVLENDLGFWKFPTMIRMDYSNLPKDKPLGGIPIFNVDSLSKAMSNLFSLNLYPLLHPHVDRFKNIYSVGMRLTANDFLLLIESVGQGFDASDIRLGNSSPHQTTKVNLENNKIIDNKIISDLEYKKERDKRKLIVRQYQGYIKYINSTGNFVSSLDNIPAKFLQNELEEEKIPELYKPLSTTQIKELADIAWDIFIRVLPSLPPSKDYIISLSYTKELGWVLWDIYGGWYVR